MFDISSQKKKNIYYLYTDAHDAHNAINVTTQFKWRWFKIELNIENLASINGS